MNEARPPLIDVHIHSKGTTFGQPLSEHETNTSSSYHSTSSSSSWNTEELKRREPVHKKVDFTEKVKQDEMKPGVFLQTHQKVIHLSDLTDFDEFLDKFMSDDEQQQEAKAEENSFREKFFKVDKSKLTPRPAGQRMQDLVKL